jgi:hypothetical protein
MAKLPAKLWPEMTTTDFAALDRERVVAVLPVGAIEQHGPHLPVVDACIKQGIIDEVLRRLLANLPVTFLPLMSLLGHRDVFGAFRDQAAAIAGLAWHRFALIAERQPHRDDIVVFLLLVIERHLGRDRAVEVHHDSLGVKGVVVIGIVSVDRTRRHKAFLVGSRRVDQRLDRRLFHSQVVEVQPAVVGAAHP